MRHNIYCFFLFVVSVFATANQTIIPLPELTGSYTNGVQKTVSFDSGLIFSNIDHVEIHLTGSYTRGLLMAVGTGGYETMDMHLKSTSPLAPELWGTDDIQAWDEGPFSLEEVYYPLTQDANWDLLLNGQVEVQLEMPGYVILAIYAEVIPVSYYIQEAYLEVWASCNSITIQRPNTREYLLAGSSYNIEWLDCRDVPSNSYLLSYSIDNGQSWIPFPPPIPVSGTNYNWQVPEVSAEYCLVRIEDFEGPLSDVSDTPFAIYECTSPPAWDLTGDCYVNLSDFQLFASDWLQPDGYTLSDLESFAQSWLNCSNPFDPACSP